MAIVDSREARDRRRAERVQLAAAALTGLAASIPGHHPILMARDAVEIADATLKALEETPNER